MREHLYVDNVDLATYGVYISGAGTFAAPEKQYNYYDVPGRDGSVLGYERRLGDIEVSYNCFIYTNFDTNIASLRSFLLSRNGRVKISDTYHPNEYRMGTYEGPFEPSVVKKLDAGQFVLTFRCLPQRWLASGQTVVTASATTTSVSNPTLFTSKPLFRVYGYGAFEVQPDGVTVEVADYSLSYVDVDSETMNAYNGSTNLNGYVGFKDANTNVYGVDAPVFQSGANSVTISSGSITKIEITPRWWEV